MKEQIEAFLADLVEVCKKHNMALAETDLGAIHLRPWPNQYPTPGIFVAEITPTGTTYRDEPGHDYDDGSIL